MCWKRGAPGRRGSGLHEQVLSWTSFNLRFPSPLYLYSGSVCKHVQKGHPWRALAPKMWKFSVSAAFQGGFFCYILLCVLSWWTCPVCWDLEVKWCALNFVVYIVFGRRLIQSCWEHLEASPQSAAVFPLMLFCEEQIMLLGRCYRISSIGNSKSWGFVWVLVYSCVGQHLLRSFLLTSL